MSHAPAIADAPQAFADAAAASDMFEIEAGKPAGILTGVVYANGDRAQYLDLVFRMRWTAGDPHPALQRAQQAVLFLRCHVRAFATKPSVRNCCSSSDAEDHGRMAEFLRSSGGLSGKPSDQPPCPTSGSSGRFIPTTAVDQYTSTLALWFGLPAAEVPLVFPNIGRFGSADLGFMA